MRLLKAVRTPRGEGASAPARGSALPSDLVGAASRRLGILALVLAGLAVINLALAHTLFPRLAVGWSFPADAIVAGVAVASLGVFLYTRWSRRGAASFITLGLAYELALAGAVAVLDHFGPLVPATTAAPYVSRMVVVIVLFAAIVPSTPGRTLAAALAAASTDPLAMAGAIAIGQLDAPPVHVLSMHIPNYLAAGIAMVISHVVTRLGREVRDARELGSYRLGEVIGRGGMGEVYHATHRMLARPAAIKLIRADFLESRSLEGARVAIERFRREAEAAANLRSPHTIELYDFGVSEEGVFYYVMELLDGIDLESLVERFGPLPPERAIHLLRQACESLAEAHAKGLMHRDIKPSNIHTCRMGLAVDFVKLLDFGLVKPQPGTGAEAANLTTVGGTPGTPAYMAPEAVSGDPEPNHRADIYALGCVGYWLLTGALVFDATSTAHMMLQHVDAEPLPPSRRTETEIPPELDAVILACLAKRPADRPAGARELSGRLAACPVREAWTPERAAEWWELHLPAPGGESNRPVDGVLDPVSLRR